jgi:hypothetical protein
MVSPMSAKDVALVRQIYDAFANDRFPVELLDEGFEWKLELAGRG